MQEEERQVRPGTYSVTLTASDWGRILLAVGAMRDEYRRMRLWGLAADAQKTHDLLYTQVMESV